jgi:hypothetical protein
MPLKPVLQPGFVFKTSQVYCTGPQTPEIQPPLNNFLPQPIFSSIPPSLYKTRILKQAEIIQSHLPEIHSELMLPCRSGGTFEKIL